MAQHALLSPSAAHRWLHCTIAPRIEADFPDTASPYAEEGTLAHAIAARKLKQRLGLDAAAEEAEIEQLAARHYAPEMEEHTDCYADIVLEKLAAAQAADPDARLMVETRLDFGRYVPRAFGTADAIVLSDGLAEVVDFKYGRGVEVSAEHNEQMMIYALGAYLLLNADYLIDRVRMTIVQPRIGNLSEWELSAVELMTWAEETLRPRAELAWYGGGEPEPGDWCRFCRAKAQCRALAARCMETAGMEQDPRLLSVEELARDVLPALPVIKTWMAGVEEHALQQALAGTELPGWKVVEGRSVRRIADADAAAAALCGAGYRTAEIYRPQELRPIGELERLAGKKQFAALCGAYVEKPRGKPALAPLSDKRPPFNAAEQDFAEVKLDD